MGLVNVAFFVSAVLNEEHVRTLRHRLSQKGQWAGDVQASSVPPEIQRLADHADGNKDTEDHDENSGN